MIKSFIFFPITLFRYVRFIYIIYSNRSKTIYLVDIDNTIADSWPSLLVPDIWINEQERVKSLAIFIGMKKFLAPLMNDSNSRVIFFSARSVFSYKATFNWLMSNYLITNSNQIVITRTALTKYFFLKNIFFKVKKIIYIDDLSHKHETGKVALFEDVVTKIKKIVIRNDRVIYLGTNFIDKINCNYDKSIEEASNNFILYSKN